MGQFKYWAFFISILIDLSYLLNINLIICVYRNKDNLNFFVCVDSLFTQTLKLYYLVRMRNTS
ncbi:hypothetical protein DKP20_24125 [Salmonella enterica subsp. salamae]|uniref:Uncharacterized protein n=1 Tax=Salmonella enterica subsp. salamae serovar 50:b:z6 TaxID=1967621 RepID=A0A603BM02_SALER|nr:hypothetical protein [Salmonella enterica subsp. salamae]ECE6784025.1 hypothetical protein [Salmonella enterica subsp. salamae]ECG0741682.1 hypothetical protein [Salmonella enterica subsp. salamae]ECI5686769.1 hypothetical protein [Salmonella enterica subsp. salamae]ECT8653892.1 hypothetical protein [Salmonella enterica subsp. salamae serovar 50:b:z6]